MNLDQLKNAWQVHKFQHSMPAITRLELLDLLASEEEKVTSSKQILAINIAMFLLLILCCQGG